jgi:hypothetical protein
MSLTCDLFLAGQLYRPSLAPGPRLTSVGFFMRLRNCRIPGPGVSQNWSLEAKADRLIDFFKVESQNPHR